jgi:hypothetical protein
MANYTKTTNFTAKDALPTGNAGKIVSGVDFDLEFDNIQTSNNSKIDTAGSGLVKGGTTLTLSIGTLNANTIVAADSVAFYDASTFMSARTTFANFEAALTLANMIGYDANDNVDHTTVSITAGTALTGGGTIAASRTLNVDETAIKHDNLSGFINDEHVNHSGVTLTAGTGLTGGGTIALSRTFNLDISGLTSMTATPVGTDSFLYNDGGTMKQVTFNQSALPSRNVSSSGNFASTDVNEIVYWTGTTGTLTMPTSIGQDDCYIIVVNSGSGNLTIAGSGVTITSGYSLTAIPPGGVAALIRETSTVWFLGGTLE